MHISNLVTDFIFGIIAIFLSTRLRKSLISLAFFFVGISALLAGVWHGFGEQLPYTFAKSLWFISMCFLLGFSLTLSLGVIRAAALKKWIRHALYAFSITKFLLFLSWYSYDNTSFLPPFYDYSISLFLVLIISIWKAFARKAFNWIIGGVLIAFFAGFLWIRQVAIPILGDYNDLFHIIQTVSAIVLFVGFRKIQHKTL